MANTWAIVENPPEQGVNLAPVRFCHWNAPQWGQVGELAWNTAFKVAELAIAVTNSMAQQEIADNQMDLADRWYSHAKYKWNRFNDIYKPLEIQLLEETSNVPMPKFNCVDARIRANAYVNTAHTSSEADAQRLAKKYCVCMNPTLAKSIDTMQNLLLVDTYNYNYSDDRWFRDFKEDQRWNRRSNVLNIGRNTDAMAMPYAQIANKTFDRVSHQLDRAAGAAMSALGYYGARNDTFSPMTYLSTGGRDNTGVMAGSHLPQTGLSPTGHSAAGTGG